MHAGLYYKTESFRQFRSSMKMNPRSSKTSRLCLLKIGERKGVDIDGTRVFPILLGLKADWSYLVSWICFSPCCSLVSLNYFLWMGIRGIWAKETCFYAEVEAGNLQRSCRRGPKHAGDEGKGTNKPTDPGGICHLCQAGLKGFDWEDVSIVRQ